MSELGKKLRDARIEKGYTLNTLQQMTKIQKKYLVAIEEGKFSEMPGNFYARAFVKQYADMVGLDGDELLLEYQDELEQSNREQMDVTPETQSDFALPSRLARTKEKKENSGLDTLTKYLPVVALVLVVMAIMSVLAYYIMKLNQSQANDTTNTPTVSLVNSVAPDQVAITSEETTEALGENEIQTGNYRIKRTNADGEETVYELLSPSDKYAIEVRGLSYVWVGIYVDGNYSMDTTINEGDVLNVDIPAGASSVRVIFGYPEGGDVYVNDVKVPIDNMYVTDSLSFAITENTGTAPVAPTAETSEEANADQDRTTEYQGPAVLDPNYSETTSGQ